MLLYYSFEVGVCTVILLYRWENYGKKRSYVRHTPSRKLGFRLQAICFQSLCLMTIPCCQLPLDCFKHMLLSACKFITSWPIITYAIM